MTSNSDQFRFRPSIPRIIAFQTWLQQQSLSSSAEESRMQWQSRCHLRRIFKAPVPKVLHDIHNWYHSACFGGSGAGICRKVGGIYGDLLGFQPRKNSEFFGVDHTMKTVTFPYPFPPFLEISFGSVSKIKALKSIRMLSCDIS